MRGGGQRTETLISKLPSEERFSLQKCCALAFEPGIPFRSIGIDDSLYDGTSPCAAVWADGAWAESFIHVNRVNNYPSRAGEERRMVVLTEVHIDQVPFPTD